MRKKVTVVGGGFVGSTTAQRIHDAGLADVVLTDILDGVPAGKALDMAESAPILGTDVHAAGISTANGDYRETANSDIIVITAGFPRKPGQLRRDQGCGRSGGETFARRHLDRGHQSTRRHGPGRIQTQRILEEPSHRNGRRAGLGADEHVCGR